MLGGPDDTAAVSVRILKARKLTTKYGQLSQVYVLARIGAEERTTLPSNDVGPSAGWDFQNEFQFDDVWYKDDDLVLEVFTEAIPDERLGVACVNLADLRPFDSRVLTEKLADGSGELKLEVCLEPSGVGSSPPRPPPTRGVGATDSSATFAALLPPTDTLDQGCLEDLLPIPAAAPPADTIESEKSFDSRGGGRGPRHRPPSPSNFRSPPTRAAGSPPRAGGGGGGGSRRLRVTLVGVELENGAGGGGASSSTGDTGLYAVCEVPGRRHTHFETNVVGGTTAPEWNRTCEFDYSQGDALQFKVFNKRQWPRPAELLGEIKLPSDRFFPHGLDTELQLQGASRGRQQRQRRGREEPSASACWLRVRVEVPDAASSSAGIAQVSVIGACGLREDALPNGEVYCVCSVLGKEHLCFETPVHGNMVNPRWNHLDELEDVRSGDSLVFEVWGKHWGSRSDFLGRARLRGEEFFEDGGFRGELQLEEAGRGVDAYLILQVTIAEPGSSSNFDRSPQPRRVRRNEAKSPIPTPPRHQPWRPPSRETSEDSGSYQSRASRRQQQPPPRQQRHERQHTQRSYQQDSRVSDPHRSYQQDSRVSERHVFRDHSPPVRISREPSPWGRPEAVKAIQRSRKIKVVIISLRGASSSERGCKYAVRCEVQGRSADGFQTQAVAGRELFWNHEHIFEDFLQAETMEFHLIECGALGEQQVLAGTCSLRGTQVTYHGFNGELTMTHPGMGIGGLLRVKVSLLAEGGGGGATTVPRPLPLARAAPVPLQAQPLRPHMASYAPPGSPLSHSHVPAPMPRTTSYMSHPGAYPRPASPCGGAPRGYATPCGSVNIPQYTVGVPTGFGTPCGSVSIGASPRPGFGPAVSFPGHQTTPPMPMAGYGHPHPPVPARAPLGAHVPAGGMLYPGAPPPSQCLAPSPCLAPPPQHPGGVGMVAAASRDPEMRSHMEAFSRGRELFNNLSYSATALARS